jgi:transcriptional regulator with XRE-family HTH domain
MHANHATMLSDKSQPIDGENPLVVAGKSALDVLLELLDITQKDFCDVMEIDTSTFRRWRQGKPTRLTHVQAKTLDKLLRKIGLTIQDLPDDLSKWQNESV